MADTDNWGGVAVNQPKPDDWGGVPIQQPPAPKIPDMSGAQKTVQDNLAANDNKAVSEGGEPKPPPTQQEQLDKGLGFSSSALINGEMTPSDVPQSTREDYSNHVKAGTIPNGESYAQMLLHSVLPIVASGIQRAVHPIDTAEEIGNSFIGSMKRYDAMVAAPLLSKEQQQDLIAAGDLPKEGIEVAKPGQPTGPELVRAFAKGWQGTLGNVTGAAYAPVSATTAPLINPALEQAQKGIEKSGGTGWGQAAGDIFGMGMDVLGVAGIAHLGEKFTNPQFAPGTGPWDNHLGSDIIKPDIAKQIDKDHAAVTSDDFDQTIAKGSKGLFPNGSDYENVAKAMGVDANNIHTIYKATGVHPEQIYKDAQNDHAIAASVQKGEIPTAYSHLIDRPKIPEHGIDKIPGLNGQEQDVHVNPTPEQAKEILANSQEGSVRSLTDKDGNLYMWDAYNLTHNDVAEHYGIERADSNAEGSIHRTPEDVSKAAKEAQDALSKGHLPDDVQEAMRKMEESKNAAPSVDLSKEGSSAGGMLSPLAQIFNPTGMSEASGDMATALRQGRGPVAQYIAQIQDGLSKFSKTISGMTDEVRLNFIHYIETRSSEGATLTDPHLQALADKVRDIYSTMADKILQIFPDVKMRKDYFTHQYTDEAAAAKFFSDWAAKQGSERNLQARAFPTLKEAMEAGLKPKTTNPIETVMQYVENIGKLDAAHRSLNLAREAGIADYFPEGQQPEGWVPLGGRLANEGGKLLYAPEDAARVYNNDISKGFTGPVGEIFDAANRVNNFNNMLMLSSSLYHATLVTLSSMAKDVGRALTQGSATDRATALLSAVTPLKNTLEGGKLIGAYLGREELTPDAQKTMDALVKNNAINIRQQDYWKAGPAKTYIDVFQHGSVGEELQHAGQTIAEHPVAGVPMVIANEVGRVMNTISSPLFEHYIPQIKLAASFNEMHAWMKEHPDATSEEVDKAAQDIGNNSDNAFGEMNRDNLFWHNITRQTLQTAFLSYSWITGAARMLQGIPDIGKTIMGKQELTSNARYLMGMAATYAAVNGVRTYLGTGQAPNQILDFIYPRTGGTTPEGKEERELLPSHIGQFTQYLFHGIGELGNEASPTLKLLYHLLSNSDFRGLPITNANNSWFTEQKWGDYAKYVLGEEIPIGLKTFITGAKKGSEITPFERALGVRQAPREITDPEGYDAMMKRVNDAEYKKKEHSDTKMKRQYENDE